MAKATWTRSLMAWMRVRCPGVVGGLPALGRWHLGLHSLGICQHGLGFRRLREAGGGPYDQESDPRTREWTYVSPPPWSVPLPLGLWVQTPPF